MASINKRGTVWWVSYYVAGQQVRKSLKTTNKVVAQEALAEIEARLTRRELGMTSDIGVDEWVTEYLEYSRTRKRPRTLELDAGIFKHFSRYLQGAGIKRLSGISSRVLEDYMAWRRQTAAPVTVNRDLVTINHALAMAKKWGYIHDSVKAKKFRIADVGEYRFLSFDQVDLLLEHSQGHHLHPLIAVGYYAGLRLSEIVNLTWEDVQFDSGFILVRNKPGFVTKSLRNRTVPLSTKLKAILLPLAGKGPCFTHDGHLYRRETLYQQLQALARSCGLNCTWKDLRESFGSHHAIRGRSLYKISRWLGHADIKTTEIHYAHLSKSDPEIEL